MLYGMPTLTLELAKGVFFDRAGILTAAEKAERKFLASFGAYCRRVAMNSIRTTGPREHSRSPAPPFCHTGLKNSVLAGGYKTTFFFVWDRTSHAVYIGPIALNGAGQGIPALMEFGGDALIWDGPSGRRFQRMAHYAARPHMRPAFERSLKQKLPDLENCVVNEASASVSFRG